MMITQPTLIGSARVPLRFVFFMWLIFALEFVYGFDLTTFGLIPRDSLGAIGIITAPFFHGDLPHLISNTIPFVFLGTTIFYYYPIIARKVFFGCYLFTNIAVWLFARQEIHIGASGIVYGLATFIISLGFFRRDFKSLFIALFVAALYGPIYYGILPTESGVSWESHLFGSIVGIFIALYYRNNK